MASTAGALAACNGNRPADFSQAPAVISGSGGGSVPSGTRPANILLDGDVFRLLPSAFPTVKIGQRPWDPSYGPGGNGVAAPAGRPFPGLNQYSAVLRFNNDPTGWVGLPMSSSAFTVCTMWPGPPVRLLFYVNDPIASDNSGSWWISFDQYYPERYS